MSARRREQLPGTDPRAEFDSLNAFATPAENPSEHGQSSDGCQALIRIPCW